MHRSATRLSCTLAFACGVAVCLLAAAGFAADGPARVDFSNPAGPMIVSNLYRLDNQSSLLGSGKDASFKPLDTSPSSLSPVMPPLDYNPGRRMPDAKSQQQLDERKNWIFPMMSELEKKDVDLEAAFGVKKTGIEDQTGIYQTTIEKFYEESGKKPPAKARLGFDDANGKTWNNANSGSNSLRPWMSYYSSANQETGGVARAESSGNQPAPANMLFNSGLRHSGTPTVQESREMERRAEWQKLLAGPSAAALPGASGPGVANPFSSDPLNPLQGGFNSILSPATVNPASFNPSVAPADFRSSISPTFGADAQTPSFRPQVLDDPTRRALGLPQLDPRAQETTPKPAPTPYQFESQLPQRKF